MAIGVVHRLEAVQVEKHQRGGVPVDVALNGVVTVSVVDARQVVVGRLIGQLLLLFQVGLVYDVVFLCQKLELL